MRARSATARHLAERGTHCGRQCVQNVAPTRYANLQWFPGPRPGGGLIILDPAIVDHPRWDGLVRSLASPVANAMIAVHNVNLAMAIDG